MNLYFVLLFSHDIVIISNMCTKNSEMKYFVNFGDGFLGRGMNINQMFSNLCFKWLW